MGLAGGKSTRACFLGARRDLFAWSNSLVQLYYWLRSVFVFSEPGGDGLGFVVLALDQRLTRQVVDALQEGKHHQGDAATGPIAHAPPRVRRQMD